jgi:cell division septal protein FtsQ
MAGRKYKRPYRAKKKKTFLFKAPFWFSLILLAAFGGGISFACFSPWFQVKDVKITGANIANGSGLTNLLRASAQKQLAFLPSKSILLFDMQAAKRELLKQFPEVADIQIKRQFPGTIYAAVLERSPIAALRAADGSWDIVDDTGIYFKKSQDLAGLFEISAGLSRNSVNVGQAAIDKSLLQKILRTKVSIENDASIPLAGAAIINRERVDFTTVDGWRIFTNPQGDLDWQVSKLQAVTSDQAFAAQRKNLDYVDLRFTRVYVKQK